MNAYSLSSVYMYPMHFQKESIFSVMYFTLSIEASIVITSLTAIASDPDSLESRASSHGRLVYDGRNNSFNTSASRQD